MPSAPPDYSVLLGTAQLKQNALLLSIALCYIIRHMSKPDLQVNFRIPAELKARLEAASKENHRSLTAELVARLEESFAGESLPSEDLIPASKAIELSRAARAAIPAIVKKRIIDAISRAASMGHAYASVELDDLELEEIPESDQEALMETFGEMLADAGYLCEWDGPNAVWIQFPKE